MTIKNIKETLLQNLINIPGWRTNRKIVVIESDDWGSVRMPSHEVYLKCLKAGYRVDKNPYERYDALESETDLRLLFDLLQSYTDYLGNNPIITANCVVANPDFDKIRDSDFKEYHYELVTETFKKYPEHAKSFELWKTGNDNRIFRMQFHGREHLNVSLFMRDLQQGVKHTHFGFNNFMPGCINLGDTNIGNIYVEATKSSSPQDNIEKLKIILEGLDIFEILLGYKSESYIPTNYYWNYDNNSFVKQKGVIIFQGVARMKETIPIGRKKYRYHYFGEVNEDNQIYLIRNCSFEPSFFETKDVVKDCLSSIKSAFFFDKPAVISSHRLNYIGFIDRNNRDRTLILLDELIGAILKKWPDVEFMSSDMLGNYIIESKLQNEIL